MTEMQKDNIDKFYNAVSMTVISFKGKEELEIAKKENRESRGIRIHDSEIAECMQFIIEKDIKNEDWSKNITRKANSRKNIEHLLNGELTKLAYELTSTKDLQDASEKTEPLSKTFANNIKEAYKNPKKQTIGK